MIQDEFVTLVLGMGVLASFTVGQMKVKILPDGKVFLLSFSLLTAGWMFTVLEGFFWPDLFNLLEHLCYAVSTVLLALWCWRVFSDKGATVE